MSLRGYQKIQLQKLDTAESVKDLKDIFTGLIKEINDRFQSLYNDQTGRGQSVTSTALTVAAGSLANVPQLGTGVLFELSATRSLTIPGFGGGYAGRVVMIRNTGPGTYTILHESLTALAPERVRTRTGTSASIGSGQALFLIYDDTSQRWQTVVSQV